MEVQGKDMMEDMDWANSRYNEFQATVRKLREGYTFSGFSAARKRANSLGST